MTVTLQSSSAAGLLALLAESSRLLDQATAIEEQKLPPASDEDLQRSFPEYAAALALVAKLDQLLAPAAEPAIDLPAVATEPAVDFPEPATEPAVDVPEVAEAPVIDPLQEALDNCAQATQDGYQMAKRHLDGNGEVIRQAKASLARTSQTAGSANGDADLLNQLKTLVTNLETDHQRQQQDIEAKRERLDTFNITLFGRTMAGKSTLMEILTNGDGKSIGKGAQRTTQDVREYPWQGLTVTDVPGVAAFGGAGDEEVAHQAAGNADLVLFLITADAPQNAEAEHLARLRQQGRHVLGICNVKQAIDYEDIDLFLLDLEELFNPDRLDVLNRQFDEMADRFTPGRELDLISAHLLAKYEADRMQDSDLRDQLEQASRFWQVEKRILDEVVNHGPFLRTRSFLDSATVSALGATEGMLVMSNQFAELRSRLTGRVQELRSWRESFSRSSNQQIDQLVQQTVGSLRNQIPAFAEEHCEDKQLSDKWNQRVQSANIEQKMRATQQRLSDDCRKYVETLIADIREEIRLVDLNFQRIALETGSIHDTRRMWNWGVGFASAGLGSVTAGLYFAGAALGWNPLGWALLGAGALLTAASLIGRLFGNRDKKRREAIAKITPELRKHLGDIEQQIRTTMKQRVDEFTRQYLNQVSTKLNGLAQSCGQAATLMRETAWRQHDALLDLNRQTLELALRHLGHADAISSVTKVARIPGQAMVLATASQKSLSDDTINALQELFNESMDQVSDRLNARQIIEAFTESYRKQGPIRTDDSTRTARLQFDDKDVAAKVQIQLASQLSGLHITNLT